MADLIYTALGLTALLWLVDYALEGKFIVKECALRNNLISFAAGLSVTYIFLHLFPMVYSGAALLPRLTFIAMLVGFTSYHLIEKFIYKYGAREDVMKELEVEHSVTLFFYHFSIGIVLIPILENGLIAGLLYFAAVSLHVIINVLPDSHNFKKKGVKMFFTSAPFFGALFAVIVDVPQTINTILLGLIAGILLFLEVREVIPKKRTASPVYFLLGVIGYSILIIATWLI